MDVKKNKKRILEESKKQILLSLLNEIKANYTEKDYNKVISLCNKAIEIDKENHISYLYKANSLQQVSKYNEAVYMTKY